MFKTDLVERRIIGVSNTYQLKEPLIWDDGVYRIEVPVKFIYNGGSVPRLLWPILPAKRAPPPTVHTACTTGSTRQRCTTVQCVMI